LPNKHEQDARLLAPPGIHDGEHDAAGDENEDEQNQDMERSDEFTS
jgi:hypothetical protein